MKKTMLVYSLMAAGLAVSAFAADNAPPPPKPAKEATSFLSGVSIAPMAIIAYKDVTDAPEYGAGLSLGYTLNKYVTINADLIAFKNPDNWGGSSLDETDLLAKFDLLHASKLTIYGVAGGGREWNRDDWAIIVGGGGMFSFTKRIAIFGEYDFQVWVDEGASSQIRCGLNFGF